MKHTYRYLRPMLGDRDYAEGDTRELAPSEAKHLVDLGVLEDLGPVKDTRDDSGEKEAPPAQNKAAPPHANKSRKGA